MRCAVTARRGAARTRTRNRAAPCSYRAARNRAQNRVELRGYRGAWRKHGPEIALRRATPAARRAPAPGIAPRRPIAAWCGAHRRPESRCAARYARSTALIGTRNRATPRGASQTRSRSHAATRDNHMALRAITHKRAL